MLHGPGVRDRGAARATVTLSRGPERPRFSRHETREQADEPRWAPLPLKSET